MRRLRTRLSSAQCTFIQQSRNICRPSWVNWSRLPRAQGRSPIDVMWRVQRLALRPFSPSRHGAGFYLFHYLAAVCLYGDLADTKFAADLFIQKARSHQRHDLPLAGSERSVTLPESLPVSLVA